MPGGVPGPEEGGHESRRARWMAVVLRRGAAGQGQARRSVGHAVVLAPAEQVALCPGALKMPVWSLRDGAGEWDSVREGKGR